MESEILRQLKRDYPTPEAQRVRLVEMVDNFGSLSNSEAKFAAGDILCLAKLLYDETGDRRTVRNIQRQIFDIEDAHEDDAAYLQKLEYLKKCLTDFRPTIFRNIQLYFAELYHIDPELITCLPKVMGQQVGAKVEIKRSAEDINPIMFYAKAHQQFCSKSHPQFIVITSDGTGTVDFKELFIYRFLQYIGYGPKVHFIIDRDIAHSRVDEGILIATQDLGYTKRPAERGKIFKTFREVNEELTSTPVESIASKTRQDIIAIDMLSRAFLLEDVMINQGNFGITTASALFAPSSPSIKWKIIDFVPPPLRTEIGDDYSYARHYPHAREIFYSFKIGNASHAYDREGLEIIKDILFEEKAHDLWLPAVERLSSGNARHLPLIAAVERAFADVVLFMRENSGILHAKPERLERRLADLDRYRVKAMRNFEELERGIREYLSVRVSAMPPK